MITIEYNDSTKKSFYLKSLQREQSLYELWMWLSMHDRSKKFKITTQEGTVEILIAEIKDMKWEKTVEVKEEV